MHTALLYLPERRLSLAELCAARLDGHLVEVGEGFMPADTVESPAARALAIGHLVPAGTAVMGPSAAWIHGAGDGPPARHHILRSSAKRVRAPTSPRVLLHEMQIGAGDAVHFGPVAVTSALRTLCDLARLSPQHPDFAAWALLLAESHPGLAARACAAVTAWDRTPGKRRTLEFLRTLP